VNGWVGKLLRVNLTEGSCKTEDLDSSLTSLFLGGRGVASKILFDEVDPLVDPLGTDNKLIFMTGPITGLRLPTSTKFQLSTKSPISGSYLCTNSSGNFGPFLKKAGFYSLSPFPISIYTLHSACCRVIHQRQGQQWPCLF